MLRMQRDHQISQSKYTTLTVDDRPSMLPTILNNFVPDSNSVSRKNSESRLYEAYLDCDESPSRMPNTKVSMTKMIKSKFNRLIPGKSIDFEKQMIREFVRKSKEMEI